MCECVKEGLLTTFYRCSSFFSVLFVEICWGIVYIEDGGVFGFASLGSLFVCFFFFFLFPLFGSTYC